MRGKGRFNVPLIIKQSKMDINRKRLNGPIYKLSETYTYRSSCLSPRILFLTTHKTCSKNTLKEHSVSLESKKKPPFPATIKFSI